MLICPQCKFENPNINKFCQNCGTSLTVKSCQECATEVPVNAERCHECGTESGTVWWAIILKDGNGEFIPSSPSIPQFVEAPQLLPIGNGITGKEEVEAKVAVSDQVSSSPLLVGSYLDPQERYQLLEELPPILEKPTDTEVGVRVLDCQPYQISFLSAMLANQKKGLATPSVDGYGIPQLAKPYIALQSEYHQGIPRIHDAWHHQGMQVVLIEDYSRSQNLLSLLREDTITSLHIIHFFYQMTQFWQLLEPLNCRQSLLELSNLRMDEDQILVIQRLYVESRENLPLTIKALGRVWQAMLRQSERTQFGSIVQLMGDLEMDKIETIAALQSRLSAIASELQSNSTNSEAVTSDSIPGTESRTILQLDDSEDSGTKSDDMPTVVLPMQLISLEDAGRTDVGRQRQHNEDYFGFETQISKLELPRNRAFVARGLYVLCDGMGGHAGGEVASELAVNTLRQFFQTHWTDNQLPDEDTIREGVFSANQAIFDINQKDARSGVGRMGTTLVLVLVQDSQVAVAHVGDSRLYRLTRRQGLEQMTIDHEVGQREISRGVEPAVAYSRPDAYQLTQALGPRDENSVHPDVRFFEINEDTLFVLASDGLSDNDLLETHWQTHLEPLIGSSISLEGGVSNLIDLGNQYNGHDNITAVLIRAKVRPMQESQK
jgi:protein phosphatase